MERRCVSEDNKLHGLAGREKSIVEDKYKNTLIERVNYCRGKLVSWSCGESKKYYH